METPRQPYNLAAKFADQDQAKRVYIELESRLKALRFDAHVSRVMVAGEMYVSFISERPAGTIPTQVLEEVRRILASRGGQLATLPPEAIANIQARRAERRAKGIGQYESHETIKSSYKYPAIRDAKTKEVLAEYPDQGELTGEEPYTGPLPSRSASTPAPAKEGRKPTLGKKGKPLIERYFTYLRTTQENAQARLHNRTDLTRDQYNFSLLLMTSYGETYRSMANKANKYRLAASAQMMIDALRPHPLLLADMGLEVMEAIGIHKRPLDPDIETPILHLPVVPVWLELEEPVLAANAEIAGIFFTCADRETEQMLAEEHRPSMRKVLAASIRKPGQEVQWSLNFISSDGAPTTRYQYQEETRRWSIVPAADGQQICPTGECREQPHEDGTFDIIPCPFCAAMLAYWRSWLVTALLAVAGEFASTEAAEWPHCQEHTTRKVKRPNSSKYDEVKVTHDYYLVSFDASVRKIHPERPTEHEPQERGSWVAAAQEVDPESVIYVRHDFAQGQRRLDPERNPRWRKKQTVEVKAHTKRIPMKVISLQKRITRVIASQFEQTEKEK